MEKETFKSKFKCWKADLYGSCKNCLRIHKGMCDYSVVMNFKPVSKRNRCPICDYKKDETKCAKCSENRNRSRVSK